MMDEAIIGAFFGLALLFGAAALADLARIARGRRP